MSYSHPSTPEIIWQSLTQIKSFKNKFPLSSVIIRPCKHRNLHPNHPHPKNTNSHTHTFYSACTLTACKYDVLLQEMRHQCTDKWQLIGTVIWYFTTSMNPFSTIFSNPPQHSHTAHTEDIIFVCFWLMLPFQCNDCFIYV